MRLNRTLNLANLLEKKSFFHFWPRATGKSSLIRNDLADRAAVIDLLKADYLLRLTSHPEDLEALIRGLLPKNNQWIVIDEIQKVPFLLDEVHRLIEENRWCFHSQPPGRI